MATQPDTKRLRAMVWRDAEKVSGENRDGDGCVATALLLASAIRGPSVRACAELLDLPRTRLAPMGRNLRRNGVWRGGKVYGNWEGEHGGTELTMDACVALGLLERAT